MNVILTGASRGIGFQTALALSKSGVKNLVLVARNREALELLKEKCEALSPEVKVIIVDADIIQLVKSGAEIARMGNIPHIDVLINNAGTLINKDFNTISLKDSRQIFDVNFHAPAQLIKVLLPLLKRAPKAHVLNISSIGGFQGSSKFPGLSYYSATKAALASLTESLASEFSKTSICFNCLALGAVQTEMLAQAFPGYQAPVSAEKMGSYIADFALRGHEFYNGQILPVRLGNP